MPVMDDLNVLMDDEEITLEGDNLTSGRPAQIPGPTPPYERKNGIPKK